VNRLAARIFPIDMTGLYEKIPETPLRIKNASSAKSTGERKSCGRG